MRATEVSLHSARGPRRSAESGSAYLFVLLALLVLTAIGLSLVAVTQTEVQIGGAEKTLNRTLYGADSGARIQFVLSRFGATRARQFVLSSANIGPTSLTEVVDLSPFFPIFTGACSLCSVNLGEEQYWAVNYVMNSEARRIGVAGGVQTPQAQRRISEMYFIQPERGRAVDESVRTYDPSITEEDPTRAGLETLKY